MVAFTRRQRKVDLWEVDRYPGKRSLFLLTGFQILAAGVKRVWAFLNSRECGVGGDPEGRGGGLAPLLFLLGLCHFCAVRLGRA